MKSTDEIIAEHLLRLSGTERSGPFVVGICGAQGSGKSWTSRALAVRLQSEGLRTITLSLDDLYLPRAQRKALSERLHPLFAVRGVPGTHDVAFGLRLLEALGMKGTTRLPAFDKASDNPVPQEDWEQVATPVDVVLFEGWCVGACPQDPASLARPVNRLERDEDPDATWRSHVNGCLAGPYRELFARIDMLVLLQAPDFDIVASWRLEQEDSLRQTLLREGRDIAGLMDRAAIERFVMFYERLTRHILAEMPSRADLTIALDRHRKPIAVNGF